MSSFKKILSGSHILVQRLSYGTLASEEFLHHALNLLTESSFVEIQTEHILAGIELLQTGIVLISLAYLQRSHDGLEFCQQWVGRWLKWLQVVIQRLQITGIASQYQRNQNQVALVETTVDILLDGLTETDREFLTGIGSDALRSIWHVPIWHTRILTEPTISI